MHKYVLVVLDWLALTGAYVASLNVRKPPGMDLVSPTFPYVATEILFFAAYACGIVLVFHTQHLYKINVYTSILNQAQRILKSLIIAVVGLALISFFTKAHVFVGSRLVLLYFVMFGFLLLVGMRIVVFRTAFLFAMSRGWFPRRLIIVGAGHSAIQLARDIRAKNPFGLQIVGFLDDERPSGSVVLGDLQILGRPKDVAEIVRENAIREVIFLLEGESDEYAMEMLDCAMGSGVQVMVGSKQFGVVPERVYLERYDGVPLFSMGDSLPYLGIPGVKRVFDIVVAAAGLLILSPLFGLLALAIKLDSHGPIFYRQTRLGVGGKPFSFYKFRSMRNGSDNDLAREEKLRRFIRDGVADVVSDTKIVDEHRVTRVGRFMRKTSIDELPQLFNVLRGDMSLVGPRPCLPSEWNDYAEWHKRRLNITPGCTGVWQVLARSEVGFRDMVILDLFYAHNISFHLDVWLMIKTLPVMLFGSGGR